MSEKQIDELIVKVAKVKLYPYGILQKEDSLTFIDDNKWFLTIIKFAHNPLKKIVSSSIGLNFLWYTKKNFTMDFLKEETNITYIDSDDLYANIYSLMQTALDKTISFRKFRDLFYAKEQILQAKYNTWKYNYYKMIVCFLCEDYDKGVEFFKLFSENIGLGSEDKQFIEEQKEKFETLLKNNDKYKVKNIVHDYIFKNIKDQRIFYNQNHLNNLAI